MGNRELLAVKLALEEWRHWLEGAEHPFVIYTDHKNLEYLQTVKHRNPQQAHWSLFFARFHFTLSYCPGSKNTKAVALSHLHAIVNKAPTEENVLPSSCFVGAISWVFHQVLACTPRQQIPTNCPPNKLFVLSHLRTQLTSSGHTELATGHPVTQCTFQVLIEKYWWPNILSEIQHVVSSCPSCAQAKVTRTLPAGKLLPLPILQCSWSHLAFDFLKDLPVSQGNATILVVSYHSLTYHPHLKS